MKRASRGGESNWMVGNENIKWKIPHEKHVLIIISVGINLENRQNRNRKFKWKCCSYESRFHAGFALFWSSDVRHHWPVLTFRNSQNKNSTSGLWSYISDDLIFYYEGIVRSKWSHRFAEIKARPNRTNLSSSWHKTHPQSNIFYCSPFFRWPAKQIESRLRLFF